VYDDHRTLLNVIFEAKRLDILRDTPNLVYFDHHDDACKLGKRSDLLDKIGVDNMNNATNKQFWSFVEFDLGTMDDDWLLTGMELDLIKDAILIGAEDDSNMRRLHGNYISEDGTSHKEQYIIDIH
jgi:hypothetical protein